jgi:hypothetical protein
MTSHPLAGAMIVCGALVFMVGAAIGVPRVFTERDPEARLRLLQDGLKSWKVAQPLCGLGPVIVAAGVGVLAAQTSSRGARTAFAGAALALLAGALAWAWQVYQRAGRIAEFAAGTLPQWPFTTYVLLTIGGIALLGSGLLAAGHPAWLGWLTLGVDALILAAYLRFGDIPPFVFYLLLPVVGVVSW